MFMARALVRVLVDSRFAVDVEIPLRAAARWLAGEPPYLVGAFSAHGGANLPFLYPPATRPFLAGLPVLPRTLVDVVVVAAMVACAIRAIPRSGFRWPSGRAPVLATITGAAPGVTSRPIPRSLRTSRKKFRTLPHRAIA